MPASASEDFPRGIILTVSQVADLPGGDILTLPAAPGIAWVVTDMLLSAQANNVGNAWAILDIQDSNGTSYNQPQVMCFCDGASVSSQAEWTGKVQFPVGVGVSLHQRAKGGTFAIYLVTFQAYPV